MVFAPSSVHREQYGSFWSPEGFAGAPLVLALPENRHESNVCGRIRYRMCTFSVLYQRKLALIGPIWGSEQEFDKRPISRSFPEKHEFGLGDGHTLSLEEQIV